MNATAHVDRSRLSPHAFPCLALMVVGALAVSSAHAEDSWKSPLKPGAWAAEFGTNLGFDYGFGVGTAAILSLKRHRSERTAFRWSLGFRLGEGKGEGSTVSSRYGTPQPPGQVDEHNESSFLSTTIQWMAYRPASDRVAIFLAVGPTFRYSHSSYRDLREETISYDLYEHGGVRRHVGLHGSLGFEWFFTNRLSLGGAIDGRGGYEWGNEFYTSEYTRYTPAYTSLYKSNVRTEGVSLNTDGSSLALTAYF